VAQSRLGEWLVRKLAERGETPHRASLAMGLSSYALGSIISGRTKRPLLPKLQAIASYFGVPLEEVLALLPPSPAPSPGPSDEGASSFARWLWGALQEKGLSPRAAAKACGLSESLFVLYLRGKARPSDRVLGQMARFFGVNVALLRELRGPLPPRGFAAQRLRLGDEAYYRRLREWASRAGQAGRGRPKLGARRRLVLVCRGCGHRREATPGEARELKTFEPGGNSYLCHLCASRQLGSRRRAEWIEAVCRGCGLVRRKLLSHWRLHNKFFDGRDRTFLCRRCRPRHQPPPSTPERRDCKGCGKTFTAPPAAAGSLLARFCSFDCYARFSSRFGPQQVRRPDPGSGQQPRRRGRGRRPRDPAIALEVVRLHDEEGWTFRRIGERYGWAINANGLCRTAFRYYQMGKQLLERGLSSP
jgi:transcriptional regulator with XRE-family HTH domain